MREIDIQNNATSPHEITSVTAHVISAAYHI